MPAGPCTFKKNDLKRLIDAARKAGEKPSRIEMEGGKVILILADEDQASIAPDKDGPIVL